MVNFTIHLWVFRYSFTMVFTQNNSILHWAVHQLITFS